MASSSSASPSSADKRVSTNGVGMAISPFASRLAKPRKTGDAHTDTRRQVEHTGLQQLITILQAHPDLTLETLGIVQKRVAALSQRAPADAETRFADKDCTSLGRLPAAWFLGWVQQHCGGALNDDLMSKMMRADSQAAEKLRAFSLQMSDGTRLPDVCKVQKLCARVFNHRHKEVASPLSAAWVEKAISVSGKIDWARGGCRGCSERQFSGGGEALLNTWSGVLVALLAVRVCLPAMPRTWLV